MADTLFVKGTEAIAEAAVRAGCRFFAGYPITPQNEIPEYMSWRLPQLGGSYVQGESEIASINMIYGAASTGTRCMTSSASPGLSLKAEALSCALGCRIPFVLSIMQRGGPGHGIIFPAQQDYLQATHAPGHGGVHLFVLAPATGQEAVDLTYEAFDIADRYRTGVLVLGDGFLANTISNITLPPMRDLNSLPKHEDWKITVRPKEGEPPRYITSYNPPELMEKANIAAGEMYEEWHKTEARWEEILCGDAETILVAYGASGRICREVVKSLRAEGYRIGLLRPITLFPFPKQFFEELDYDRVKLIASIEMSLPGQMVDDIRAFVARRTRVEHFGRSGGIVITPGEIEAAVKNMIH